MGKSPGKAKPKKKASPKKAPSKKTGVYTMRNKDKETLYVGMSKDPKKRAKQHAKKKDWYPEVTKTKVKTYPNRESAAKAEKKAIQSKSPKYNIVHNRK